MPAPTKSITPSSANNNNQSDSRCGLRRQSAHANHRPALLSTSPARKLSFPQNMSSSSELPTVLSKPAKTRTKLPIYLIAAIVVALVVAVTVINIVHRLPESRHVEEESDGAVKSSTLATSEESSSSSSDEEEAPKINSTLTPVTTTVTEAATVVHTTITITTVTPVEVTTVVEAETTVVEEEEQEETSQAPTTVPVTAPIEVSTVAEETSTHSTIKTTVTTPSDCGKCSVSVIETIPRGVQFVDKVFTKSGFESWAELFAIAESNIKIFAYKMNLRGKELRYDVDNSTFEGRQLYSLLEKQARSGVDIKLIDCQPPTRPGNDYDANELDRLGLIQREGLEMNLLNGGGGGIQHSKMFTVDDRHMVVGSFNFEWKSFSEKMEVGLEFHDCPCIARDASSLFDQVFGTLRGEKLEPVTFDRHQIGNSSFQFLASPSFLLNSSASWDLEALLNLIYEADDHVNIAVMQYFPSWIYFKNREFFSQIDNAIRMGVSRGIKFRILVSGDVKEEQKLMFAYLHSLSVLHSPVENRYIQVKYIEIPQTAQEEYKDRKMHSKFFVSESKTLIGSSNLAPEYFYKSTGTAVLVEETPYFGEINRQLQAVFERYWHSTYTQSLQKFGESKGFLPKPAKPSNPFGWFGFDQIGIFNEKYSASGFVYDSEHGGEDAPLLDPLIYI